MGLGPKNGDTGGAEYPSFDPGLLKSQHGRHHIGKLARLVNTQ